MANDFRKIENTDGLCIAGFQFDPQTKQKTEKLVPYMRAECEQKLAGAEATAQMWRDALEFLGPKPDAAE